MHATTILHSILSENLSEIHKKRLTCLLSAAEVSGSRLTLSALGRGLSGQCQTACKTLRGDLRGGAQIFISIALRPQ